MIRILAVAISIFVCPSWLSADDRPCDQLTDWLAQNALSEATASDLSSQPWANTPLTKAESQEAAKGLWTARQKELKASRQAEHEAREIELDGLKMPFWFKVFGDKPESGRSLYISMHGGGGAPARVNDQQYENQKHLYQPKEGVYLVPRAPNNTWNLWHQKHIDRFFDRLITNMVIFEGVDPNKVYLMGYSAGGDGVYQLAPRMADRFAAASMMAGHPNETKADGLRNLPFALFMGGDDGAYKRNQHAADWKKFLGDLKQQDPEGYEHSVTIYEGMGHWMQRKDAIALPWMAKFQRNRHPKRVVWLQDDVVHRRAYWLQASGKIKARDRIVAVRNGNRFRVDECSAEGLSVLLNDEFVDLDLPITVTIAGTEQPEVQVHRTIQTLMETLLDRDDPQMMFSAKIDVTKSDQ